MYDSNDYRSFQDQINPLIAFGDSIHVRIVVNGRVPRSYGADSVAVVEVSDDGQAVELTAVLFGQNGIVSSGGEVVEVFTEGVPERARLELQLPRYGQIVRIQIQEQNRYVRFQTHRRVPIICHGST